MLNNIIYFIKLMSILFGSLITVGIFGWLLCEFTNKFKWIPIVLYFIIMWGAIISACFIEPQVVLRQLL